MVLHIDGTRPDVRETQAALCWPGERVPSFFVPNPKTTQVSHVLPFLPFQPLAKAPLPSPFLCMALHVGHAAATLALGALLSLPFVMMACGNAR